VLRALVLIACAVSLFAGPTPASADPAGQGDAVFAIDGARGTGTDSAVECKPNCAEGTRLFNPIVVHAWNASAPTSSACPPGVQFYSDLTIAYPHGVPPWITPGTTWSPGTDFVTVDGMPAVHFSGLTPSCGPISNSADR
jgi:hypothetical protein